MADIKLIVLNATTRLLTPLIRILVRCGVSHLEFNELVKKTYVDVCYQHYAIPGRAKSISRVSVLTGLSRKEVVKWTKFIQEHGASGDIHRSINRASRVLGGWMQDQSFLDDQGQPRELALAEADTNQDKLSFKLLVKRYAGDVTHGAILDELIRIGAAERTDNNCLKLLTAGYLPRDSEIDKIKIMGTSTTDLLTTVHHNLSNENTPRFQREVVYTELSQAGTNEFKLISQEKSMALLLELNEWLAEKKKIEKKLGITRERSRTGIGIYYIEDEVPNNHGQE